MIYSPLLHIPAPGYVGSQVAHLLKQVKLR